MLVQRVLSSVDAVESWTVLGDDGAPVAPIERYLAYLTQIERSPNTVKAYAHDLKDGFAFLGVQGLNWREVRLENVAEFVAWLRRPPQLRDGTIPVLPSVEHHCTESTVNRKLSAVSAFYQHAARHGVDLGEAVEDVAFGRRPWLRVEAVLAPHQQGKPQTAACHRAERAAQASPCAHRHRGADDPRWL